MRGVFEQSSGQLATRTRGGPIVFIVWPEPGHALPAVALAKSIVRRGREVLFLSWDGAVAQIREHGLRALDVFELAQLTDDRQKARARGVWSERVLDQRAEAILQALDRLQPSLVVIDPLLWRLTLRVARRPLPVVHLSSSLPDEYDTGVFPWILKRARLMLTHGGLGSVTECLTFGVPMCVLPVKWDQPSVAARVAYHGLGIDLGRRLRSADVLASAVQRVATDPQYKLRVELMQREFARVAAEEPGATMLSSLADAGAALTSTTAQPGIEGFA